MNSRLFHQRAGSMPAYALLPLLAAAVAALALLPGSARAVSPGVSAGLSLFVPGGGQAVNGDYGPAATQFGLYMVAANQYFRLLEDEDYIEFDDRVDEQNHTIAINRDTALADFYAFGLINLSFYSSYGAYRDGRLAMDNAGYETPAPTETLSDLALAPFELDYLKRPTVFIPLLLPLYFALKAPEEDRFVYLPDNTISRDQLTAGFFGMHGMVAVGEEAFFRGVLNNGFSDGLGETWGLAASSVVFGLAHSGDAGQATAVGATLFGAYMGLLQQSNGYMIGQGVAVHFWWNFLTSLGMLRSHAVDQPIQIAAFYTRF